MTHLRVKSLSSLKTKLTKISHISVPEFASFKDDINAIFEKVEKFKNLKNIIIIANGGSQSTFRAFHKALIPITAEKKVFILTSMEPDLIDELLIKFPPKKTLVMPISKSGNTVGILESLMAFIDYPILPVTTPDSGALFELSQKMEWNIIPHPDIGGRFSGITASAYAPAIFFDIEVDKIDEGARSMYRQCHPSIPVTENPALDLAARLYLLEKKDYTDVFCPIYSNKMNGFSNFLMQIMHETEGKAGKGQTILAVDAPESQHHTNQRFFGGPKNMIGLFIGVEHQNDEVTQVTVPKELNHVQIKDGTLKDIDNVPYAKAFEFEFQGTYEDAINHKIPVTSILLDKISPFSIGEFLGFWHYVAVYSALLRGVDPFDQPQVENSKNISFELRRNYDNN